MWDAKDSLERKIHNFALRAYSNIEARVKNDADLAKMVNLWRWREREIDGCLAIDIKDKRCAFDFAVRVDGYELSWFYRRQEGVDLFNLVSERLKATPDIGGIFRDGRFYVFSDELKIDDIISDASIEYYTKKVISCLEIVKQVCDER